MGKGATETSFNSEGSSGKKEEVSEAVLSSYLKGIKLDLPRFNGEEVHNWIYKVEKYFSLHSVPSAIRLQVVALHLEGEAASWYQWMDRNGSLIKWEQFLDELQKRFGSSVYADPLGRIAKLLQT